jgi:aspartate aminotransferase
MDLEEEDRAEMAVTVGSKDRMRRAMAPFAQFFETTYSRRLTDPGAADLSAGNPQELALPAYVDALRAHLAPQDKDWYAYKLSEPQSRQTVARTQAERTGLAWDAEDVAMTNGGFAALAVALRAIVDEGDEVIFLTPPWFFYELLILAAGGEPVRVRLDAPAFDLDPGAIAAAITLRTRAVIVNSPHNPTGRVYALERLHEMATVLERASARVGHPVYLISDEPYNRILFDGRPFHSPAEAYGSTMVAYSYGKTLLAPGMRIGFLTWPRTMPGREALREEVFLGQMATGFAFPVSLLQHALEDLERLTIDVGALERRRDRLVPALRAMGYEATMPEGTFYVLAKAPTADDVAFTESLARRGVLVLPGTVVEVPGWFRISLTASDQMVDRALDEFAAAMREARAG